MARIGPALAALALLGGCSKAPPEDLTAHYAREGSPPLIVRAAASGDARVEAGDTVFISRQGTDYVVLSDAQGRFSARVDDALAAFAADDSRAAAASAEPDYVLSEGGSETVAGLRGVVWKGHPREIPSLAAFEGVVSADPALAAMGRALAMQTRFAITRNAAIGGGRKFAQAMVDLFAKGAVLRLGSALKLDRIEKGPLAPAQFDVPPPLLDAAALRMRLAHPAA